LLAVLQLQLLQLPSTQQCYLVTKYLNAVYKYLKYLTTEQCI